MADKNVKTELNAEDLEEVAGGAERHVIYEDDGDGKVKVLDVDKLEENHPLKQNGAPRRHDEPSVAYPLKDDGKKSEGNKGIIRFD